MRAGLALSSLLVLAVVVDGALSLQQTATTNPDAKIPVVLQANAGITTVLGTNATSATVTGVTLLLSGTVNTLRILDNATKNWSVQLKVLSAANMTGTDVITLGLLVNGTSQTVTLSGSSPTVPQTTAAVTLSAGGPDGNVTALSTTAIVGGCGGIAACTFNMQLLFKPPGSSTPEFVYNYKLVTL